MHPAYTGGILGGRQAKRPRINSAGVIVVDEGWTSQINSEDEFEAAARRQEEEEGFGAFE